MTAIIESFYFDLGRKIQGLRTKRGVTQEELGKRLTPRVTRASIANIESGKQRVYTHTLLEIATALDVSVPELLSVRDDNSPKHNTTPKDTLDLFKDELSEKLPLKADEIQELVLRIVRAQQEVLNPETANQEALP